MTTTTATQILRSELTAAATLIQHGDNAEIILGEHRIAMDTEWDRAEGEDVEDVVWGWTWTTYLADEDAPYGWDEVGTDGTQDEATARAAAAAWAAIAAR